MSIQTKRTTLAAAIAGVAALAGLAEPACADFYQFTFGGVIDVVDGVVPEPWETVHVGSEFEFSYIFDSEAEDHAPMSWLGLYYIESAELTIEGVSQATPDGEIRILNLAVDEYVVYFWDLPISANAVVHLTGEDILDSDELPLDLNLDEWQIGQGFTLGGPDFEIYGHADSFKGQTVPGPPGALCLIVSTLGGRRRRKGN